MSALQFPISIPLHGAHNSEARNLLRAVAQLNINTEASFLNGMYSMKVNATCSK